jgi:hypothetical protein
LYKAESVVRSALRRVARTPKRSKKVFEITAAALSRLPLKSAVRTVYPQYFFGKYGI